MEGLAAGLAGGFVLGIGASLIAGIVYDRYTRPKLAVLPDPGSPALGHLPNRPPHAFYHVLVRNEPTIWPVPGRKPAWDCHVNIEVVDDNGERVLPDVVRGRWPAQPQPILPVTHAKSLAHVFDESKITMARKINVHAHEDQPVDIALKYEGHRECYLFSNESYLYNFWQNPSWQLGPGSHRLRITVHYERGPQAFYFRLMNSGTRRTDLTLKPWLSEHRSARGPEVPRTAVISTCLPY